MYESEVEGHLPPGLSESKIAIRKRKEKIN